MKINSTQHPDKKELSYHATLFLFTYYLQKQYLFLNTTCSVLAVIFLMEDLAANVPLWHILPVQLRIARVSYGNAEPTARAAYSTSTMQKHRKPNII